MAYLYAHDVAPQQDALAVMEYTLRHNPYAADVRVNLLKLRAKMGDAAGAQAEFDRLKKLIPRHPMIAQIRAAGLR